MAFIEPLLTARAGAQAEAQHREVGPLGGRTVQERPEGGGRHHVFGLQGLGDPVEIEIRGTRICLRRQDLIGIRVEVDG